MRSLERIAVMFPAQGVQKSGILNALLDCGDGRIMGALAQLDHFMEGKIPIRVCLV